MPAPCTPQAGQVAILSAVAPYSAAWVGLHAATQGTRCAAVEPLRPGVGLSCGAFGQASAQGWVLRHEQGSQAMAPGLQAARTFLGSTSAPALVRAPAGNGGAARFIRTLKEHRVWRKTCDPVEARRLALPPFQRQDKEPWLRGRHGYKAPAQGRQEQRGA